MPLETLDRSPPPFFRQGPSALTRLALATSLALALMVADARWQMVGPLRSALATALMPAQRALALPVDAGEDLLEYFRGLQGALAGEARAKAALAAQADQAARAHRLELENQRLRALLDLRPSLTVRSVPAEVLYEAADPFSRKVVIDRGQTHGLVAGAPVINEAGVLGQVTRLYPLTAEVTLLTDRDAAIPVLNNRTQLRSPAVGGGPGPGMELRFMAANADVKVGDVLTTSGIDGIYPPGLPVARVASIERRVESGFARIALEPVAVPDGARHVLVLEPLHLQLPARPAAEAASAPRPAKGAKR